MRNFMKNTFNLLLILIFSLSSFNAQAGHGGGGGGHGHGHGKSMHGAHGKSMHGSMHAHGVNKHTKVHTVKHTKAVKTHPTTSAKRFTPADKTTIENYFNKNPVKANGLPPGIAMNLERGKPLPPGIEKRFLPEGLQSTLPTRPGYEYRLVGDDAVLVNSSTDVVEDIISNVLK